MLADPVLKLRHSGQVATLRDVFGRAAKRLLGEAERLALDDTCEAACARIDEQLSYLQAAYDYYAIRIDQHRGDGPAARALAAADEVIWSCYRLLFPGVPRPPRPPPLSFFDPRTSPWVVEEGKPFHIAEPLGALLAELDDVPLRLLGVPRWMAREPWSLVLLVHELGHHVLRERALQGHVEQLVVRAGGPRWRPWAEETFADLFAISACGGAFLLALAEVLRAAPASMIADGVRYPPVVVRLRLCSDFATGAGVAPPDLGDLAWDSMQAGVDTASRKRIEADLPIARAIAQQAKADASLAPLWIAPPDPAEVAARAVPAATEQPPLCKDVRQPWLWACGFTTSWLDAGRAFPDDDARADRAAAELSFLVTTAEGGARAGETTPDLDATADQLLRLPALGRAR